MWYHPMKSSNMEAVVCSSQCSLYKDWTKEEKALLFPHQTTETIQTECQIVTNVTQMLANRLQGSFIPQIKRIPPSNDISFNLLWIKCQCSFNVVMQLFFEISAMGFPIPILNFEQNERNPTIVLHIDFVICLCWRWSFKIVIFI